MKVFIVAAVLLFEISFMSMSKAQQMPFDWSISQADSKYDVATGENDAKAYLRLGDMLILEPGPPPIEWQEVIRDKEYRRFGVEWRNTGDVSTPEFEEYRKGFNGIMEIAIKRRLGEDFFDKTERRIKDAILKTSQKKRKH
jgi:hypothetical protein